MDKSKTQAILIVGIAHSYTSAISKFIYDNGGEFNIVNKNFTKWLPYDKYEDSDILTWTINKKKFKTIFITLASGIAKAPEACFFLDSLSKDIKIIYCLRNPNDLTMSYIDKYKSGFMTIFNRYVSVYNMISHGKQDTYILMTERIINHDINEAKRLLAFCDIDIKDKQILFDLRTSKIRKMKYIEYRFMNTIWKLLSRIFKTYINIQ